MNCEFEEEVSAYFDGELELADAARVAAHVKECVSCRPLLDDLQSIRDSVRPLRAIVGDHVPLWRRRLSIPFPLAAALALLFLGGTFVTLRRNESRRPIARPAAVAERTSDVFTRYDGGGRAVIVVRAKEVRP